MPIYFGNKNISEISFGDKSIAEVYYGDKLVFQKDAGFTGGLYTVAGSDVEVVLNPGNWIAVTRGGGGSGGENGKNGSWAGGSGGAGAKGELTFYPFTLQYLSKVLVHVGEPGLTVANGGNGGAGGTPRGSGKSGGNGGGGGKPSYIADNYEIQIYNLYGARSIVRSVTVTGVGTYNRTFSRDKVVDGVRYYGWYHFDSGGVAKDRAGWTTVEYPSVGDLIYSEESSVVPGVISAIEGGDKYIYMKNQEAVVGDKVYSDIETEVGTITEVTEHYFKISSEPTAYFARYPQTDKEFPGEIVLNNVLTYADGGGGGGGGGGCAGGPGRRAGGGSGGGGGGYYQVETIGGQTNIISVPGKQGGSGASYYQYGGAGQAGRTTGGGSDIKAGNGGGGSHYQTGVGGAGGTGFGASGGGGNAGDKNNHTHESAKGGAGGGGAGGSLDASGGGVQNQSWGTKATTGSNYHTTPTDTLADNIKYAGVNDTYGIGGTANTNGTGGFVLIKKVYTLTLDVTPSDASVTMTTIGFTQSGNTIDVMAGQDVEITLKKDGYNIYKFKKTIKRNQTLSVTMELIDTLDMGSVTGTVERTIDCGTITGSVTETINAGDIYEQTIPTA